MKKFMKICAVTTAIMLVLGMSMLVLGGCGGGLKQTFDKLQNGDFSFTDEDMKKIIDDVTEWGEDNVIVTSGDEEGRYLTDFPIVTDTADYEKSYDLSEVTNLSLQIGGCEMKITVSPDDKLYIRGENIRKLQDGVKDQTLYLITTNKDGISSKTWSTIEMQIPAGFLWGDIHAEFGAGDFELDGLRAGNIEIDLGAGRLQMDNLSCTEVFACKVGAGQVIVTDAVTDGDVLMEIGAGELRYDGSVSGNIEANCAMGNLDLCIRESTQEDHNYEIMCSAGNVDLGSKSYSGLATQKEIDNDASTTYKLNCAMGNITLKFE